MPDRRGGDALLCSAGLGAFSAWADEVLPPTGAVAFVDIAARPLGSPAFLEGCRAIIAAGGQRLLELDLAEVAAADLRGVLDAADAVFVTGGYPLYLLEWAQRSSFLAEVRSRFRLGDLAYVGVSAGAALAGPDMAPLASKDDPGQVADTTGLGIVDFVVLPHADRRTAEELGARQAAFGHDLDLRPLRDDRAFVVSLGEVREVPSP